MFIIVVVIFGLVGLVLGMFNVVFLMLVVIFGFIVWKFWKKSIVVVCVVEIVSVGCFDVLGLFGVMFLFIVELIWDELCLVDLLGLEVGYWLILLVDKN